MLIILQDNRWLDRKKQHFQFWGICEEWLVRGDHPCEWLKFARVWKAEGVIWVFVFSSLSNISSGKQSWKSELVSSSWVYATFFVQSDTNGFITGQSSNMHTTEYKTFEFCKFILVPFLRWLCERFMWPTAFCFK